MAGHCSSKTTLYKLNCCVLLYFCTSVILYIFCTCDQPLLSLWRVVHVLPYPKDHQFLYFCTFSVLATNLYSPFGELSMCYPTLKITSFCTSVHFLYLRPTFTLPLASCPCATLP